MPQGRSHCWVRCLALAALLPLAAMPAYASLIGAQIRLSADPPRAPADGRTSIVISIEVLDGSGAPAPDGSSVHLVTTLGDIVSPVQTVGGLAQTVLTPSTIAGTALVSAMVGSARANLDVEFTGSPGSASPGARMVRLSAEELSYNPDRKIFVASPAGQLSSEIVEVSADVLQYDVMANLVCAHGDVALRAGSIEIRADALRYDLATLRGRLLRAGAEEPERLLVEGERLQTRPDTSKDEALWAPYTALDTRTWVKAQTALIRPREKVILDHASFYVDDLRVMALRRHVVDPRRGYGMFGNIIGYSSILGPDLDIPVYYRASGSQIGAIHITHNRTVGGMGGTPGWALGVREEYIRDGHSEGTLAVRDVTDPGRGLQWRHQLTLGPASSLSLDAGVSHFDDASPRLRSAGLSFAQAFTPGRLSLSVSGSEYGSSTFSYGAAAFRFRSRAVGSGVLVTPSVNLRHSRRYNETSEVIVDPQTGEQLELLQEDTGVTTSPGVDLDIALPTREILPRTHMVLGAHTGYAWGLPSGARSVFDGRAGITHRLASPGDFIRLGYTYSGGPASLQPSPFRIGRQRASLNGRLGVDAWSVSFNASKEIGGDRLFGYLTMHRDLPWGGAGGDLWTLQISHMFTHLAEYRIGSSRLALGRRIGQYRLSACYSPQGHSGFQSHPWVSLDGFGYTYSGGSQLWIEVSGEGFWR